MEIYLSQLWKPEVQHQGANLFSFWAVFPPWLADGPLLTVCSHGLFSALAEDKDTIPTKLGPHPNKLI